MVRVCVVFGTRAEIIKLAPIIKELREQQIEPTLIHTGQHDITDTLLIFGLGYPHFVLTPPNTQKTSKFNNKGSQGLLWSLTIIRKLKRELRKLSPDYVIIHGDTMSTAAAALAASRLLNKNKSWKTIHVEAGLRSKSILEPFPEELSRKIADRFSDILCAPSIKTAKFLKRKYKNKKIFLTGNTIIDAASLALRIIRKLNPAKLEEPYAIVSVHRNENIKNKKRLTKIINIVNSIPIKTYFIHYDNTNEFLKRFNLENQLKQNKNIIVTKKSYPEFIHLLKNSKLLITDGGSIQEESLIFKKPAVILRHRTERPEGLKTGLNFLTKLDERRTIKLIKLLSRFNLEIPYFKNPYGEEGASKKIVELMKS